MSGALPQNVVSYNGVGAILDANLNAFVQTDQTATNLRGFVGITGMAVMLQGINAPGDGGGGLFYWSNGTAYTDNNGNCIVPYGAVGAGAWLRATLNNNGAQSGDVVSVTSFGAVGDGATNDTTAFVAGLTYLGGLGGGTLTVPAKRYLIDPLTIPANVVMQGDVQGPFEGFTSPADTVYGPTLLVNSTGSAFITLSNGGSGITDFIIFYPQQVAPTASTPTVYPACINNPFGSSGAGCKIRRLSIVNAYIGINIGMGRALIEDCHIGAYKAGIIIDGAEDYVMLNNIMIEPFYDVYAGLSVPQTIDAWVLNNGVGIQLGRVDSVEGTNVGIFVKYQGFTCIDSVVTTGAAYGVFTNVDCDTVAYGVEAISTNLSGGGMRFSQMNVGANPTGLGTSGQATIYTPTGGISAPRVWWDGGAQRGTWVAGQTVQINAGLVYITNVYGLNPFGVLPTPSFPNTTVPIANPYPFTCRVFVSSGTVTALNITGANTVATGAFAWSGGMFEIGQGEQVAVTYTGSPTWLWLGL